MTNQNETLRAVGDTLGLARDHVIVGVADAVNSTVGLAGDVKDKLADGLDVLVDRGGDLLVQVGRTIRARPIVTVGAAIVAGFVIAKLLRRD